MKEERRCIFPASFDPVTFGHVDLIERAAVMFDGVDVVVMDSCNKKYMYSAEQRLEMVKLAVRHIPNVRAVAFEGLTCDYLEKNGLRYVVRGLRNGTDFDYEMAYFAANRSVIDLEMIFLPTRQEFFHISSSVAREVILHNHRDLNKYVPEEIIPILKTFRPERRERI